MARWRPRASAVLTMAIRNGNATPASEPERRKVGYLGWAWHLLYCVLWFGFLRALASLGAIAVDEGCILRLDRDTILRREPDGGAFIGPPFCWKRIKSATRAFRDQSATDMHCPHTCERGGRGCWCGPQDSPL